MPLQLKQLLDKRLNIPIEENGEPLRALDEQLVKFTSPHPYVAAGAPYDGVNPFFLRDGVASRLDAAARTLHRIRPGFRLFVFDAYRPVRVQDFMRHYEFRRHAEARNRELTSLSNEERDELWSLVDSVWAQASNDAKCPPPHATGAAVDVTIIDANADPLDMGSAFDEASERILPDYYAKRNDLSGKIIQQNRELLNGVMTHAGFARNPREWWHFSHGDQLWALIEGLERNESIAAIYGFADESQAQLH